MAEKERICPRCGKHYTEFPALSRRDNKTDICPECGEIEAFEDAGFLPPFNGKKYWVEEGCEKTLKEAEEEETKEKPETEQPSDEELTKFDAYREKLEEIQYDYSDEAYEIVCSIINELEDNENKNVDVCDLVWERIDEEFIYYADAFKFLQENHYYDFEDAFKEGFGKNVCTIACYYCEQEVYEILGKIGLDY